MASKECAIGNTCFASSHPKAATLLQPGGGGDNKANSQIVDSGILMETNVPTRDVSI